MASPEGQATDRIGQVLRQKWTLERLLGVGGMAAVYAARHRNGARGAVKVLHPEMSVREDVRERFLREGYAANKVGHPGTVQVLDDDVADDGSAFLVMELLEGESLTARVNRTGGVPVDQLLAWTDQILDVLVAAHAAGIVHRDLKPDNIFVTSDDRIKVLDFGIARVADAMPSNFRTRTGTALGTVPYMAPEQALGSLDEIDGRTDLFAVGATLFRILAGRKVHEARTEADLLVAMATMAAPPLGKVKPDLMPPVCALVDRALAFLPSHRYPDARAMQGDLRAVRAGLPPPVATEMTSRGVHPSATKRAAALVVHEPTVREGDAPAANAAARSFEPTVAEGPPASQDVPASALAPSSRSAPLSSGVPSGLPPVAPLPDVPILAPGPASAPASAPFAPTEPRSGPSRRIVWGLGGAAAAVCLLGLGVWRWSAGAVSNSSDPAGSASAGASPVLPPPPASPQPGPAASLAPALPPSSGSPVKPPANAPAAPAPPPTKHKAKGHHHP